MPIFWTGLTIIPFDTPHSHSTQRKVTPRDNVPAQPSASSKEFINTSTPPSWLADLPYAQHDRFFFDDGNIIFLVKGILCRVHQYFFCRNLSEFEDRLSWLSTQQEQGPSSPPFIPLHDVKPVDFDAFLSLLYPLNFNTREERSFEEWSSILDLSTRWGFASIRDLAIRSLKPPTPTNDLSWRENAPLKSGFSKLYKSCVRGHCHLPLMRLVL
ncbi:hypothetical protein BJV74DRAFT_787129 [Russula compacta]|nr:hypothetical protein BJV74DRAFT_787129 [Russula compacta]